MTDYKEYCNRINNLSNNTCHIWPEQAFAAAGWSDLATNIDPIYRALKDSPRKISQIVEIGYMDESRAGMGLAPCEDATKLRIPILFNWCAYRGLCLSSTDLDCDGYRADISVVGKLGSSILLRLLLHAEDGALVIHKVDPKGLGKNMMAIPAQSQAPLIETKEKLIQLLKSLKEQLAHHPIAPLTWRCDTDNDTFASDSKPIQVIIIANWADLFDIRDDKKELSEAQKIILEMLSSDVPARNGIYFFICGYKTDLGQQFHKLLPTLALDKCGKQDWPIYERHRAHLYSQLLPDKKINTKNNLTQQTYYCKYELPTESEIANIHKVRANYLSGTLSDSEGEGVWLGNSAKGLRAIMGVTPQGENQFFELGVGQAYDAYHALIGGATGSGKSVLLSEIICSLAERYAPSELRMLLLDYKEGTEFAPFAKLPHVYALSVGANAEFGLEVLKEVQKEIGRRGSLFKEVNAKNLAEYRKLTGSTMCRYVLVADEFQVLLGDKKYGDEAKTVLNDLVRRGRSFGFHAILATQTLRDGCLDGEAKNQFGCRIAMRMAESETDYFLSSGNTVPSTFNCKGQALLNYALGRKESNIIFQSGNKNMPKKFRDTPEVLDCVNAMHDKAVAENCLPTDVYIYSSDGFAEVPLVGIDSTAGALLGLRNDMQGTPVYLSQRQLGAKVLILGGTENKRNVVLNNLCTQLTAMYNEPLSVQTPADYLDYPTAGQVTILNVPEGDFDLEDAIADWKEAGEQAAQCTQTPVGGLGMPQTEAPAFSAPEGMEADFAELMQSMQMNNAMMNSVAQAPAPRRGRNRDTRCLIVAIGTAADIKLMESAGMYVNDFRTVIYLDNIIYNQVSGEYENAALGDAAALLESPRGVVSKIRLVK